MVLGLAQQNLNPTGMKQIIGIEPNDVIAPGEALQLLAGGTHSFIYFAGDNGKTSVVARSCNGKTVVGAGVIQQQDLQMGVSLVEGTVEGSIRAGKAVVIGKRSLLDEVGVENTSALDERADQLQSQGCTVMYVAVDKQFAGLLAVSDPIKESTPEAVRALHGLGLRVIMLTGDNEKTARTVAEKLGIDEFAAGVRPQDKHERIKTLKAAGHRVAMAGDGVNDAPALAEADVGIAMGTGTDVAIEAAGVTLVRGDLRGIVNAVRLSRRVMRNIRQNLFFAFIYNSLGVPIAAGVLYPLFGILLNPMIAGAAMSFSSVSVVTNALRLRR